MAFLRREFAAIEVLPAGFQHPSNRQVEGVPPTPGGSGAVIEHPRPSVPLARVGLPELGDRAGLGIKGFRKNPVGTA
jgi:hypothetical protein